ncbi:hypothetical protein CCACVL1_04867 [Corchorus capsularis]|uniref:Uncharacterized protein n=1 Tax=Corchorus capsularis TaxID=210143 RepID=A0A1R3JP40_COCAP|nr:hypothetical protein CCACVL1_04867 [Corchorus capsularis]
MARLRPVSFASNRKKRKEYARLQSEQRSGLGWVSTFELRREE